jgi:hypothetical protein
VKAKNVLSEKNERSKQMADEQWEALNIDENENPTDVLEPVVETQAPVPPPAINATVGVPQIAMPPAVPQPQLAPLGAPQTQAPLTQRRIIAPPPPPPSEPRQPMPRLNISRRQGTAAPRRTRRSIKYAKEGKLPVATDVEEWIQYRIEQPLRYTIASDGSYQASPVDIAGGGTSRNKIQPAPFYRASKEQINAAYINDRSDPKLVEADNLYKEARENLMQHYREYQVAAADPRINPQEKLALRHQVIQDNKDVALAEKARNRAYRRNCRVETYSGTMRPLLFQMLPDEAVDKEKIFLDDVQMCFRGNFPWQHFYTDSLPTVAVVEAPTEGQVPQQQGGAAAEREYTPEQMEIIKRKKIAHWRSSRRAVRF